MKKEKFLSNPKKVGIFEMFELYRNKKKESLKMHELINKKDFSFILNSFFSFLKEKVSKNIPVKLPVGFGKIYIKSYKQKIRIDKNGKISGLCPNWKVTKELWEKDPEAKKNKKLIFYPNFDTDRRVYKIAWSMKNLFAKNKFLYSFIASADLRKKFSKNIREKKIEIPD